MNKQTAKAAVKSAVASKTGVSRNAAAARPSNGEVGSTGGGATGTTSTTPPTGSRRGQAGSMVSISARSRGERWW